MFSIRGRDFPNYRDPTNIAVWFWQLEVRLETKSDLFEISRRRKSFR